jgi:small-conductance mechanosensitive channel
LETRNAGETAVSDGDDVTAETEQLRDQIEETRRGMSETIDAIQEKLSLSNISEQVKDQFPGKSATQLRRRKMPFT